MEGDTKSLIQPPFYSEVKTNVSQLFMKPINRFFKPIPELHQLFNRNKCLIQDHQKYESPEKSHNSKGGRNNTKGKKQLPDKQEVPLSPPEQMPH